MALNFDTITDRVASVLDVSISQAAEWVNGRYARMVTESDYLTRVNNLGTTTSGGNTLSLPSDVVGLRHLLVGGMRYDLASADDLLDIENSINGRSWSSPDGTTGLVSLWYDASDNPQLRFYPAFTATGTAIQAVQVHEPADISYGSAATTALPVHLRSYLLDGALAEGYERQEGRQDLAQLHEQRFQQGVELLRKLKNRRGPGQGPYRITVTR